MPPKTNVSPLRIVEQAKYASVPVPRLKSPLIKEPKIPVKIILRANFVLKVMLTKRINLYRVIIFEWIRNKDVRKIFVF